MNQTYLACRKPMQTTPFTVTHRMAATMTVTMNSLLNLDEGFTSEAGVASAAALDGAGVLAENQMNY